MNAHYYGLILAGGRGTRFWPRSRKRSAKQVLNVVGDRSLIQATVDRLSPVIPPERIWILTNSHLRDIIIRQLPDVPPEQILAEPAPRNTAPAIGLAAHILHSLDPQAIMGVFPADHVVGKPAAYRKVLKAAFRGAAAGRLMTVGIQPRWPETGYGYIEFPRGTEAGAATPRARAAFPREARRRQSPALCRGRPLFLELRHVLLARRCAARSAPPPPSEDRFDPGRAAAASDPPASPRSSRTPSRCARTSRSTMPSWRRPPT